MKFREQDTDPSPYAYIEGDVHPQGTLVEPEKLKPTFPNSFCHARVFFAQDAAGHLVAIKIVKKDTHHDHITRFLLQEEQEKLTENCVLPVLNILDVESASFYFAVMPRWDIVPIHSFRTLGVVLAYMHCMLKGLRYLHSKNIVHRDIKYPNTVMNYCCGFYGRYPDSLKYTTLQAQGLVKYATIDFDFAIMFPPGALASQCREHDYDPFAFDVALLGYLFCCRFQHLTPYEPMLAPLLDKMVTRTVSNRFTASEALAFLDDFLPSVHLGTPVPTDFLAGYYEQYDRWKDLPPEFIQRWSSYREPPVPRTTIWLRKITYWGTGYHWICFHSLAPILLDVNAKW
ncbi:kinase-like domain-containing protein [Armillaria novae-zelandiae]|uniref:Kinase-like domain-containing protein n=1 Tax=Armillaria novae-zelandiae TaxID=153914 RepID=A0AA39TID0_9AGAR|nr:kinase-like domain-containing protein [Armillaria novae-zelandiae]